MTEVSICVTTYNRATSLAQTIDSILNQSFRDFELIISDDCSTDHTAQLCQAYERKDSRVKYYRNESNLKMPGNLNAAIRRSNSQLIANLHDGDRYRPDLIQKWKTALDKHPEALFVFNQYESVDENGNFLRYYQHELAELNEGYKLAEYFFDTFSSGPWGTVMARRSAYEQYGYFNPEYGFISDVEMWLRLGLHGKFAYVHEPLITLTPREKTHPYYHPHWRIFWLNARIQQQYYQLFKTHPVIGGKYQASFFNERLQKMALRDFLSLAKNAKIDRVREGLFIFGQSPFLLHKWVAASLFFVRRQPPPWLNCAYWEQIVLS